MNHRRPRLLHTLDRGELATAAADRRWPKWSTMCQLRLLGNPVLNGVCVPPDAGSVELRAAILTLVEASQATKLAVRSDGGLETRAYYRGGNSFPVARVETHAAELLAAGRAVILMEPTNRFTNQLSVLLRMDRPGRGLAGAFAAEALGPGYDVGDLTRGGIRPQVTVSIGGVTWHRYESPWWSDLRVTRDLSPGSERTRRRARLDRLAAHIRTVTGVTPPDGQDPAATAADWLRGQGHLDLWRATDPTMRVVGSMRRWFDDAFMIAATCPNRNWRCLATSLSDLGGRAVFWDVVDAAHKYGTAGMRNRRT